MTAFLTAAEIAGFIDDLAVADFSDYNAEDTARLLHVVRSARQALTAIEREVEDKLAADWPTDYRQPIDVPGVGRLERRSGTVSTQWQHDELWKAVLEAHLERHAAETGGEVPGPWDVRDWFTAAAQPSWRKTALRALGIDPDDYSTTRPGRPSVQITGGSK